ncbi:MULTISPECIES: hypothetical protein [Shouchella]|uniref:DUF4190 domain-containing protein n=1 Tax=Shouchella hunanensis TaxID=766894 RepID=A0ABY7W293_9BACI|nr:MULTISPECIES: hypothetical protein [Shouchella]WDF03062.1 DUF4190 domain-containing protein [Shouchella hunanensis]
MSDQKKENKQPLTLVDKDDPSLTFLNTHVEGHDGEKGSEYLYDAKDNQNFDEEYASEFAADSIEDSQDDFENSSGKGIGTMGIVFAITSLFLVPLLLGPIGIISGIIAIVKGRKTLGIWAIAIGAISVLSTLIFTPLL